MDNLKIITLTIVAVHSCGREMTLHGDAWDDVHGLCVHCDEEYHLDFTPGSVEVEER